MNQKDFITAIKIAVLDASIEGIRASLTQPVGRNPNVKIKELSQWFNRLSEADKKNIVESVRLAVHASTFNMLCVLDGVNAIETTPDKGEINLSFIKDLKTTRLNGPQDEMLHDIYQSLVQNEVFEKR